MKYVHFNFTSLETAKQHVNIDEYLEIFGKIQAISDSFESTNTFIIGDFNPLMNVFAHTFLAFYAGWIDQLYAFNS